MFCIKFIKVQTNNRNRRPRTRAEGGGKFRKVLKQKGEVREKDTWGRT